MSSKASFVLYHDIRGPLELLTDVERGQLFLAILNYSEHGEAPDFSGALGMAFAFIKTALDRDAAAWDAKREKRREAGSLGGKQTAAKRANAVFAIQSEQNAANQAVPVPAPVPVPVSAPVPQVGVESKADKPPRAPRFTPPSIDEVREYCRERGNGVDAQRFCDFYSSNGWRVGKNPMRDWRAAVRTWERRDGAAPKIPAGKKYAGGDFADELFGS